MSAFETWSFYQSEKLWNDIKNAIDGKVNEGKGEFHILTSDIQYLFSGDGDKPPPLILSDRPSSRKTWPFDIMILLANIFKNPQAYVEKWDILFDQMTDKQMTNKDLKHKEQFKKITVESSVKKWAMEEFPGMWKTLNEIREDQKKYLSLSEMQKDVLKGQILGAAQIYKEKLEEKLKGVKELENNEADAEIYMNAILNDTMAMMLMTELFVENEQKQE